MTKPQAPSPRMTRAQRRRLNDKGNGSTTGTIPAHDSRGRLDGWGSDASELTDLDEEDEEQQHELEVLPKAPGRKRAAEEQLTKPAKKPRTQTKKPRTLTKTTANKGRGRGETGTAPTRTFPRRRGKRKVVYKGMCN
ncbi:hypothetical protein AURDEDRAFT_178568 [Auricularia subglabra TFB-10046 SS5]|uniref:Uncharacterized protein n=1 Tax=Auricularia subglabra (strain TFB-10046 / SS5) TaxID=717982 RepID=J0D199_AURST|nr:hypothetical protein AURDEDRAFT_178568 [Auricularia subglabra TFB-10046 SS5]